MKRTATIGFLGAFFLLALIVSLALSADLYKAKPSLFFPIVQPRYDASGTWDYEQILWWDGCNFSGTIDTATVEIIQDGKDFSFEIEAEVEGDDNYISKFDGVIYSNIYYALDSSHSLVAKTYTFKLDSSSKATGTIIYVLPVISVLIPRQFQRSNSHPFTSF